MLASRPSSMQLQRCLTAPLTTSSLVRTSSKTSEKLGKFIHEEINIERSSAKGGLPKVTEFDAKFEGAVVTLTKKHGDEDISIEFNINGSLDNDSPYEEQPQGKNEAEIDLKSRPSFTVDIKKGNQVLSFGCSFLPPEVEDKNQDDDFQIDEFTIHQGKWDEKVYTVDCTVLDEEFYDMLLNYLDDRGVGVRLAKELGELATAYEHHSYIGVLENLQSFLKK